MISGVAYHVIPRFSGHALHSRRLAGVHLWIANIGLALLASGFVLAPRGGHAGRYALAAGGLLSATGLYMFAFNLWRTIDGPAKPRALPAEPAATGVRKLPLADNAGSR